MHIACMLTGQASLMLNTASAFKVAGFDTHLDTGDALSAFVTAQRL